MKRGTKIKTVTYMDGSQADVIFVQTPEHARLHPELAESGIEVASDMKPVHKALLEHSMRQEVAPLEPKTFFVTDKIMCEQDVPIKLSDGTILYTDIFRPNTTEKVPVILCWSLYGKQQVKTMPFPNGEWVIAGVAPDSYSKYGKFEAADPLYWCNYDYAVCNIDTRGAFNSEGDMGVFSESDAADSYDVIEWLAAQSWCNGKVATFGNSMLGISQWIIAANRPPHLACIAPWDATSDIYNDMVRVGGIPNTLLTSFVTYKSLGHNYIEDMRTMVDKYPYFDNPYWASKKFKVENIDVPVYCAAGWTGIHLRGTVSAFERLKTPKKWIRFHRDFEWADDYMNEHIEDLKKFFDRYLKDIRNGWETTPRVRLDVMDAYDYDYQFERPEFDWPLARTEFKKLYLNAEDCSLQDAPAATESKVSYDAETGETNFDIIFNEDVEITGHSKLKLWVEADGHNNMDLFITMAKLSTKGEQMFLYYYDSERYGNTPAMVVEKGWGTCNSLQGGHPGTLGQLRVSRRKLDEKLSTDIVPVLAHTCDEYLNPGEIVPVEIELLSTSRIWHKGQTLRVTIRGRHVMDPHFGNPDCPETDNKGNHVIHTGGKYDSYLQIPVIPPKYQDGEYVYR